jgi:hypothetical protein
MVMSVRWKNSNSIAVHHSVDLSHKTHVGIVVFYYSGFDSTARFVREIAFNGRSVYVCKNVNIMPIYISSIVISGGQLAVSLDAIY